MFMNRCHGLKLIAAVILKSLVLLPLVAGAQHLTAAQPTPAATAAFNAYAAQLEARLAQQHGSAASFLATSGPASQIDARLRAGQPVVERLTPATSPAFAAAMLHHWRGTAFVPGASVDSFERLMCDFPAYPRHFSPQVLSARVLGKQGRGMQATMRIRQQHVLTVVLDTTYDIAYSRLDAQHGFSVSRSTTIAEVEAPGTAAEHTLDAEQDHGFLWRQNTYWSYEQRDGGLYMQVESISLSRSIPRGLGWAVAPFVESVPRESLVFTLASVGNALRR